VSWGPLLTTAVGGALGGPVRDMVNKKIADTLGPAQANARADGGCPADHSLTDTVNPGASKAFQSAFVAAICLGLAIAVVVNVSKVSTRKGAAPPRPGESGPSDAGAACFGFLSLPPPSCFQGSLGASVSPASFYAVLVLLLANAFCFISTHCTVGVKILVELTAEGKGLFLPDVFDFGLFNTVRDFWQGKVYFLAIFVLLFSFIWPYAKITMMALCWLAPTTRVGVKARGRILRFLDAFGKWSLLDSFILVLFMVAFNFKLSLSPEEQYNGVYVWIMPVWGFQGLLIATIMSLIMGHVICHVHRKELEAAAGGPSEVEGPRQAVCQMRDVPLWRKVLPPVALGVACALYCVSMFLDTYSFIFGGAFKALAGGSASYSVMETAERVPSTTVNPKDLAIIWIQWIFMVFCFGMVVLEQVLLFCLWVVPLPRKLQRKVWVICQISNAWACADVLVVTLLLCFMEIGTFAKFLVGGKCGTVNPVLAKYTPYDSCFEVSMGLNYGFFVLLAAVVISLGASFFVASECAAVLEDHAEPDEADTRRATGASVPLEGETIGESLIEMGVRGGSDISERELA